MKKRLVSFSLILILLNQVQADTFENNGRQLSLPYILADVLLMRPFGFAFTMAGGALLIATAPFTGMASLAEPHDAFRRATNVMVIEPARFTFSRPLGDMTYSGTEPYSQ